MPSWRDWLGSSAAAKTPDRDEALRKILNSLDQLEPERARFVAAFAFLLSRVAHADQHVSPEETREMERLVIERGGLPNDQAMLVVQLAKTANLLFGGSDNFIVAREFGATATQEQKLALLDCLFAVSSADASIATIEDNEIRRVSRELQIEHGDYIRIRARYRDHLDVLK